MFLVTEDGALTLFGFGADSFIEVMSGIGITVMILRITQNPGSHKSTFEIKGLKITGTAFYLLSVGLLAGIILNFIKHHKPQTTFWGIVISLISILTMLWLYIAKKTTGKRLNSQPIISDANCTRICIYMSLSSCYRALYMSLQASPMPMSLGQQV